MPEGVGGPGYRDELAAVYKRVAELEGENQALKAELDRRNSGAMHEQLRALDASLRRWDRVRASLAMLLGFAGLFALHVADRWSVRTALLASCTAMVVVGITLAWPKIVRARVDPKPWALDVSRRWRKGGGKKKSGAGGVRVRAAAAGAEGERVRVDSEGAAAAPARAAAAYDEGATVAAGDEARGTR